MRKFWYRTAFLLAAALSACGTAPPRETPPQYHLFIPETQTYWSNPYWQIDRIQAIQSVVHLPPNAATPVEPGIHATVQFTYDKGTIQNPLIVKSTGNPALDALLLTQVVTAKVPKPIGLHTDQSHVFQLSLQMFTYLQSFEYNLYMALQSKPEYSREAMLKDDMGSVTVAFDYRDGKVGNVVVAKSSGHKDLDQLATDATISTALPPPPPGYAGKTIRFQAVFCYDINYAIKCPTGNNVINIVGTRILRSAVVNY